MSGGEEAGDEGGGGLVDEIEEGVGKVEEGLVEQTGLKGLLRNLDYEESFEGTKLEGAVDSADNLGRALGAEIGEMVGRRLGAILGASLFGALLESGEESEDTEEARADEEEGEEGEAEAEEGEEQAGEGEEGEEEEEEDEEGEARGEEGEPANESEGGGSETEEGDESGGGEAAEGEESEDAQDAGGEGEAEEDGGEDVESGDDEGTAGQAGDEGTTPNIDSMQRIQEMSYSDLQNIAKIVGVRANLSHDEMADRVAEGTRRPGGQTATPARVRTLRVPLAQALSVARRLPRPWTNPTYGRCWPTSRTQTSAATSSRSAW